MPAQPSIKDLLSKAAADSKRLAAAQIALAKAEIGQDGKRIGAGAGLGIATLALLWFFVLFVFVTLALVLVQVGLQPWAGFLIIAGLILAMAIVAALIARSKVNGLTGPVRAKAEFERTKEALGGIPSAAPADPAAYPPAQ